MACSCKKNKPVQQEVRTPVTINLSELTKPSTSVKQVGK